MAGRPKGSRNSRTLLGIRLEDALKHNGFNVWPELAKALSALPAHQKAEMIVRCLPYLCRKVPEDLNVNGDGIAITIVRADNEAAS